MVKLAAKAKKPATSAKPSPKTKIIKKNLPKNRKARFDLK